MNDTPLAYQKGWIEFYKLKFKLTQDVLIPRPETELLVEQVIKFANSSQLPRFAARRAAVSVLDIGTGAGNIAISIAKNLAKAKITATDVSAKALKIAKANAKFHGVTDRIEFVVSNLLANIKGNFDIIVTNLPYIPTARIDYLDSSVKDFEPRIALNGGEDGFELYRKLFAQIHKRAIFPKMLIGEIDYTQAEIAVYEANKFFPKCQAEVKLDLTHRQRFLVIEY